MVGHRVAYQFSQQFRHRLQQMLAARGIAVVNKAGHKAHALVFSLFPHRVIDGGIVEIVHPGGKGPHIRAAHRAPAQHRRQQRVGAGSLLPQGGDELGGEQAGFEFSGRQIGQIDPLSQLNTCHFQNINSLWAKRPASCQYRVYYMSNI